jgi:hypothetical protein
MILRGKHFGMVGVEGKLRLMLLLFTETAKPLYGRATVGAIFATYTPLAR